MTGAGARVVARAALLVALAVAVTGCGTVADFFGSAAVHDTGIEPVELAYDGPTYMALESAGSDDLVVRDGAASYVVADAWAATWLPDGRALVADKRFVRVVDPVAGTISETRRRLVDPSRAVTQVNEVQRRLGDTYVVRRFDLDLESLGVLELPPTDNPDATAYNELARNYFGAVPTIDGVTFAKWHDGSEWYLEGDYGVARIEDGEVSNVLINANIVGLYLSADGTGLIGLRQSSGEPCGGCVVEQDLVEIDPGTGEIAEEYGVPDDYSRAWRISAIDKVGDRVAVRYYETIERRGGRFDHEQRGTWVYDGEWTMVEGSDQELTWWQGEGRVVARVDPSERRRGDGFELFWVQGDEETTLPGELSSRPYGQPVQGQVAGQLLPPAT